MNIETIVQKANEMGVSQGYAILTRCRYLEERMEALEADFDFFVNPCTDDGASDRISLQWANEIVEEMLIHAMEHSRLKAYLAKEMRLKQANKNQITDDMIERARDYPIERLIQFDRQGRATAWCHDDKNPSLSWFKKANSAFCFPCHKKFNPIDVLMDRDGMTFANAVKELSG